MASSYDNNAREYDLWFEENPGAYRSELEAVKRLLPSFENSVEIGVGTGRFAGPLGISVGLEPSPAMAEIARERGVLVIRGVAENLPLHDHSFDLVLTVTTLSFFRDVPKAFSEIYRILKPGGHLIIGLLDRETPLGKVYESKKHKSPFYKDARFLSTDEALTHLTNSGFGDFEIIQTIFHPDDMKEGSVSKPGYGEGLFVVIKGNRR